MQYINNIADYEHATGEIPYNMTNNYMFIAVLQEDKFALRGLVASLLHRDPEEITDITILNPIELGVDIDLKDYIPTSGTFDVDINSWEDVDIEISW